VYSQLEAAGANGGGRIIRAAQAATRLPESLLGRSIRHGWSLGSIFIAGSRSWETRIAKSLSSSGTRASLSPRTTDLLGASRRSMIARWQGARLRLFDALNGQLPPSD